MTGLLLLAALMLMAGCNNASDDKAPPATGGNSPPVKPVAATGDKPQPTTPTATTGGNTKETSVSTPATGDTKKDPEPAAPKRATAVFAGGCFWCVEAVFEELEGVIDAVSGYAGGTKETAHYEAVSSGKTAHAEVVQIVYDPSKISFEKLLAVHFATHDPTTLNRQGADVGPQYRSSIFYANEEEKKAAQAVIDRLTEAKAFPRKIVTILEPLTVFYPAEKYHQNYVCDNPFNGYVQNVALPKVEKVREKFKDDLKKEKGPVGK